MKATVRFLTLLLVAVMLVSCFAACGKDKDTGNTTPPAGDGTDPGDLGYELPEKVNMNGYAYKAYVRSNADTGGDSMQDGNKSFYCEDFWIDTSDKAPVPEDALSYNLWLRNKEIESAYNVKILQVPQSINMVQELTNFYTNNETYDLTIILAISAAQAATKNLLTELKGLPQLDLSHEAYDQNSIKELSMGGKLYYLSGDMNISTLDSVAPTVVNLDRYKSYADGFVEKFNDPAYESIYNLVTDGKWTMSKMLELATLASSDVDKTDGALGKHEDDYIGYFQYDQSFIYYFYGAGGRLTEMTEEGSPEFVIQSSHNGELYDFIYDNFHPSVRNMNFPHGYGGDRKNLFTLGGKTLFTDMTLWDVRKSLYLEAGFEYGLLPNPVYEAGDDYNAVVYFYNTVHLWAIPSLCGDIDKAQIMMNVMAAYSNVKKVGSTMDGYYTRTLYFSVAPDENARKVMDIIKDSTVYDIALLYDWGSWRTHFSEVYYKNLSKEYGSLVQMMPTSAIPQLQETIELFKNPGAILE